MGESRNKMDALDDLAWIQESESIFRVVEPNARILLVLEPRVEACITAKPSHVEDMDVSYFRDEWPQLAMTDANMKNPYYSTIPELMWVAGVRLMRMHHEIGVCSRVQRVLRSVTIISCIVHTKNFMAIKLIADDINGLEVFICESSIFSCERTVQ
jgi:hypothetical protein